MTNISLTGKQNFPFQTFTDSNKANVTHDCPLRELHTLVPTKHKGRGPI